MDAKFHGLPPLKRFRLMQHKQQEEEENKENKESSFSLPLPAKKRKESRTPLLPSHPIAASNPYCLPTKKRVWALQPDLVSDEPLLPFDLNVEYNPCFEEDKGPKDDPKKTPLANVANQCVESDPKDEEEDDDGIVCCICQSTDGDPSDPIVLCDGCDLMVHANCYGNPIVKGIPEGDWFCSQCLVSQSSNTDKQNRPFSCCLCPVKEGAMKPTTDGQWAHVLCALLVPEVFFEDPEGREGIDCSKVPKRRWEGRCYLCKRRCGCVVGCSEPKCPLAFHVTCGLKEDLSIEYKEGKTKGAIVAGFCKNHTEIWKKQQQTGKFKIVAREEHKR